MLKQKRIIAYILAYCLLLGAFLVARYTLTFSKSLANSFSIGGPEASYKKFHVIAHDLDEMGDLKAECKAQLGDGVRIADWNDIVAYYDAGGSLDEFISALKMSIRDDTIFEPLGNILHPKGDFTSYVKRRDAPQILLQGTDSLGSPLIRNLSQ